MRGEKARLRSSTFLPDCSLALSLILLDDGIADCRLSTLARIGTALGVKTKRLYNERDGSNEKVG